MARTVTFAATQMACGWELGDNLDRAEGLVREAASLGARVVLLQELFETPYFCIDEDARHFDLARPIEGHPTVERFRRLAAELGVVLPVSVFERAGQAFFNSLVMIDADGSALGVYRKTHIPDAIGYQEKFYFSPGDTGFRVWHTRFGVFGVGICWDQWFPESARSMALMGAEVLLFPTAIGSDPPAPGSDSRDPWQRVQQGQAAANLMPLVASNRIGVEEGASASMRFYGSSFVADHTGAIVAQASRDREEIVTATFDLDEVRSYREHWSMFRDRRPEMYGRLQTLDGSGPHPAALGTHAPNESETIAAVKAAADAIVAAYGAHRTDAYFEAFDPEATFVFHTSPDRVESRAAFREAWETWEREDGFRVLACSSSDQLVQPLGNTAVFTHRVTTKLRTNAGEETARERETIVFARQADGSWLAVHEHLSPDPQSA